MYKKLSVSLLTLTIFCLCAYAFAQEPPDAPEPEPEPTECTGKINITAPGANASGYWFSVYIDNNWCEDPAVYVFAKQYDINGFFLGQTYIEDAEGPNGPIGWMSGASYVVIWAFSICEVCGHPDSDVAIITKPE